MSADNFIAIQKRGKVYCVWMDFCPDNEEHKPRGAYLRKYKKRGQAYAYAAGLIAGL